MKLVGVEWSFHMYDVSHDVSHDVFTHRMLSLHVSHDVFT